jgi:hypothetical protein
VTLPQVTAKNDTPEASRPGGIPLLHGRCTLLRATRDAALCSHKVAQLLGDAHPADPDWLDHQFEVDGTRSLSLQCFASFDVVKGCALSRMRTTYYDDNCGLFLFTPITPAGHRNMTRMLRGPGTSPQHSPVHHAPVKCNTNASLVAMITIFTGMFRQTVPDVARRAIL